MPSTGAAASTGPAPGVSSGGVRPGGEPSGGWWLAGICLARVGFTMIYTVYSGVLPLLVEDWRMSSGRAGLIQSAFHVGFLVSLVGVGFLSDRFGAKRVYLITIFGALLSAVLFAAYARDFTSALMLYGLTGLLSGGSYTPMLAIIAQRVEPQQRGRAMGFYLAASQAGYALTLLLGGTALPVGGWKLVFALAAAGPVAGTALGAWMVRKVPNVIPARLDDGGGAGVWRVMRNKPAMLVIFAYTFHSWELLGFWAWFPFFLSAAYEPGAAASIKATAVGSLVVGLTYVVGFLGPVAGGALSDRFGRTALMIALGGLSAVCALGYGWMFALPFWSVMAVGFVYQFSGIGDSPVFSTSLTELVPPPYIGAAYSLRSLLGFGAGAIASPVFGLVLDLGRGPLGSQHLGWGLAFAVLGAGGLLSVACSLWLRALPAARNMAGGLR